MPISCTGQKDCVFFFKNSCNRVTAKGFSFAAGAVFAYPYGIKLVHGLLNQFRFVGEDARLKVAGAFSFHADACTSEVCAADVGQLAVEDQDLEMHPRTECPFKAIEQCWIFVEVLAEGWTRLLGMDKPNFDTLFDELSQDSKKRLGLRADLDIKVFDIGGANPNASFHFGDASKNFGVMGFITDVFQHGCGFV